MATIMELMCQPETIDDFGAGFHNILANIALSICENARNVSRQSINIKPEESNSTAPKF